MWNLSTLRRSWTAYSKGGKRAMPIEHHRVMVIGHGARQDDIDVETLSRHSKTV
jgi:hypothetical protein